MSRSKESILAEVAREEQRLAELERALAETRAKREQLRVELEPVSNMTFRFMPSLAEERETPDTPAEKVKLFRALFRGRQDIFPTRFVSKKTGKPGYAPECSNKFQAGLCILRTGGKCSECPNQAFSPVSDHAILDHLQGRRVMGVYPMLEDETCWFLAADFDKSSWKEDVAAFVETCRIEGIPVASDRARGTVLTHGSSSPRQFARTWRGGWVAISSPRR